MAKRERATRSDSSLRSAAAKIEAEHNLPAGCVKLVKKSGRKMRNDATVGTLRNHWEEE